MGKRVIVLTDDEIEVVMGWVAVVKAVAEEYGESVKDIEESVASKFEAARMTA